MSTAANDDLDFDLGDDDTDNGNVGKLRKDFEKQLRAKSAEIKTLNDELEKFKTQARTASLRDLFGRLVGEDKAGIAKFYSGEPTEESVKAWIAEDGALFGVSLEQQAPKVDESNPTVQAMRSVAAASGNSNTPGTGVEETVAAMRAIKGNPYAELDARLGAAIP